MYTAQCTLYTEHLTVYNVSVHCTQFRHICTVTQVFTVHTVIFQLEAGTTTTQHLVICQSQIQTGNAKVLFERHNPSTKKILHLNIALQIIVGTFLIPEIKSVIYCLHLHPPSPWVYGCTTLHCCSAVSLHLLQLWLLHCRITGIKGI